MMKMKMTVRTFRKMDNRIMAGKLRRIRMRLNKDDSENDEDS